MRLKWLGWAGIEIEARGQRVVIDPLAAPEAVFAVYGERAHESPLPKVTAPSPGAIAGMVTHLHRDHADAGALIAALSAKAPLFEPSDYGGDDLERAAIAQAHHELEAAGLRRTPVEAWVSTKVGALTLTALPAVDGTGDPQVSWLVEADGRRVLHLGDTVFHGWWWRIVERFGAPHVVCAPINGARLSFPHRRPASSLPGVMDPEQAALAAELLQAERLVPIHYDGYSLAGVYEPEADALERVTAASERVVALDVGGVIEV